MKRANNAAHPPHRSAPDHERGWVAVGKHRAKVAGDVFHSRIMGELRLDELERLYAMLERSAEEKGVRFHVMDLHHTGEMRQDVRRWMTDIRGKSRVRVTIAFGAPMAVRFLVGSMQRAMAFLGRPRAFVFRMVATEADAMAIVSTMRSEKLPPHRGD